MAALAFVVVAGLALLAAYFTYGRWLSRRLFQLDDARRTPAHTERDDDDYVPSRRSVVFGHHFTSIAGTGPIVGPAIAVMWGWLPALLWVVLGSIFIGAVHDLGSLVVSLRSRGRSIGDIAGDLLGPRVRLIFLAILIVGLWIVLSIFGLVISAVLRQYPAAITPILVQTPIAVAIGIWAHRSGRSLVIPSIVALALMYLGVVYGNEGMLGTVNAFLAAQPVWIWTMGLLAYCYLASVLPVWVLLQPRDYINALQLVTSLSLITVGLVVAGVIGGTPGPSPTERAAASMPAAGAVFEGGTAAGPDHILEINAPSISHRSSETEPLTTGSVPQPIDVAGGEPVPRSTRPELEIVAPMINWQPLGAPPLLPMLFVTIACGACSGFHCLVSSGTTSKQVDRETDARTIGYGSMLTEGLLATLVIAACAAGIGLGVSHDLEIRSRPRVVNSAGAWELEIRSAEVNAPGMPAMTFLTESILPADATAVPPLLPRRVKLISEEEGAEVLSIRIDDGGNIDVSTRVHELADGSIVHVPPIADHAGQQVLDPVSLGTGGTVRLEGEDSVRITGPAAFATQYRSWDSAEALPSTVAAFVQGAANLLAALGIPHKTGIPLIAVMVAAFAATTLDTACRLQRYVIQELARTFLPRVDRPSCRVCAYDLSAHIGGTPLHAAVDESGSEGTAQRTGPLAAGAAITCPECGMEQAASEIYHQRHSARYAAAAWFNPFKWLATTHGATLLAVVSAFVLAMGPWPPQGQQLSVSPAAPLGAIQQAVGRAAQPTVVDQFATWIQHGGQGGLILWPLFGATNQLLAGFAFVVIAAWLVVRRKPVWFLVLPGLFMLAVPAAAMVWQAYIGNAGNPSWAAERQWTLTTVATITLALEAWLLLEIALRWRRGRVARVLNVTENEQPGPRTPPC